MSKRFKSQEYFRYPGLGTRWRRPRGLQSKLRIKKGGSGMKVDIGYGSAYKQQPVLIRHMKDFEKDCKAGVLIASGVGCKKVIVLAAKAKELGLTVVNMKKAKKALRFVAAMKKRKESSKKKKDEVKKEEAKAEHTHEAKTETKGGVKSERTEKVMGFDEDVVPQLKAGKKKTYRIRDHNLKVGDNVVFKNTQSGETLGHAKITKIEKTNVEQFNLKDPDHYVVYNSTKELIAALKKRNPDKQVTEKTEMFAYTYEFTPLKSEKKEE